MRFERSDAFVNVLEIDPGLVEGLDAARAEAARAKGRARLVTVERGPWSSTSADPELGFLVLEGFLWRRVTLGDQASGELLGPGDLIRPFGADVDDYEMVPSEVSWTVLEQAWVAEFGGPFLGQMREHPEVVAQLVRRSVRRSQGLALRLALVHLRLSAALHFLLWQLADRFGRGAARGCRAAARAHAEHARRADLSSTTLRGPGFEGAGGRRADNPSSAVSLALARGGTAGTGKAGCRHGRPRVGGGRTSAPSWAGRMGSASGLTDAGMRVSPC